jgi:hypothetical protein
MAGSEPHRDVTVDGETPSCPTSSPPQQYANPSAAIAHVCVAPLEIATKERFVATRRGVVLPSRLPSPIPPNLFDSQQKALLSTVIPHVVLVPTVTDSNNVS